MTDLLPCPFCGCEAIGITTEDGNWHFAYCHNTECCAEGPCALGESGAAEAWNRRVAMPEPPEGAKE